MEILEYLVCTGLIGKAVVIDLWTIPHNPRPVLVWEHGSLLVRSEVTSFLPQMVKIESPPLIAFRGVKALSCVQTCSYVPSSVVIALPNPALRELNKLQ